MSGSTSDIRHAAGCDGVPCICSSSAPEASSWGVNWYPCNGGYHDYVVGRYWAVCNRCDAVVERQRSD